MRFFRFSDVSFVKLDIFLFLCLVICEMSTPFRLQKLVGGKHVVAAQEIPQFQCNKLHVEKHIGRGSFGEVFLTEFKNTDKEPSEKVVVKDLFFNKTV